MESANFAHQKAEQETIFQPGGSMTQMTITTKVSDKSAGRHATTSDAAPFARVVSSACARARAAIGAVAAGLALGLLLSACGSGDSSPAATVNPTATPSVSTTISGTVVDAFVVSASVTPYQINADGSLGAAIACVPSNSCPATSDANGNYTINLGSYSGPVMLQATGGSYTDTVTGQVVSLPSGLALSTILPSV